MHTYRKKHLLREAAKLILYKSTMTELNKTIVLTIILKQNKMF